MTPNNLETKLRRRWLAAAAALASLLVLVPLGAAAVVEAPTRSEYVARLESICKPRVQATERVTQGVRDDMRAERLGVAATKFSKGAQIFSETVDKMATVPRPSGDTAKLEKWFGFLAKEESWLRRITVSLRAGHEVKAQRATGHFIHSGNLANNVVIAFGFNYCSFRFSRFG